MNSTEYYSREEVARRYDEERFCTKGGKLFDILEKEVVISASEGVERDEVVLDAGAGSGRFTIELAKRGFSVVAVDISKAMQDVMRERIRRLDLDDLVHISRQDLTSLSLGSDEFGFVCCMRVLVNLDNRQNLVKALNELVRVCKPEGKIVFDSVNPVSAALLGPRKESMVCPREMKEIIKSLPNVRLEQYYGRRILSQTAFELMPAGVLGPLDLVDSMMSRLLPQYCVRNYFVLRKIRPCNPTSWTKTGEESV